MEVVYDDKYAHAERVVARTGKPHFSIIYNNKWGYILPADCVMGVPGHNDCTKWCRQRNKKEGRT